MEQETATMRPPPPQTTNNEWGHRVCFLAPFIFCYTNWLFTFRLRVCPPSPTPHTTHHHLVCKLCDTLKPCYVVIKTSPASQQRWGHHHHRRQMTNEGTGYIFWLFFYFALLIGYLHLDYGYHPPSSTPYTTHLPLSYEGGPRDTSASRAPRFFSSSLCFILLYLDYSIILCSFLLILIRVPTSTSHYQGHASTATNEKSPDAATSTTMGGARQNSVAALGRTQPHHQ